MGDFCTKCDTGALRPNQPMCDDCFVAHWNEMERNILDSRVKRDGRQKYHPDAPRDRDGKAQLYRHFDADHNLLYIGVTFSAFNRLMLHKSQSHWIDRVAYITIQQFNQRSDAEDAEIEAIKTEQSKYNKGLVNGRWL